MQQRHWTGMGVICNSGGKLAAELMYGCMTAGSQVRTSSLLSAENADHGLRPNVICVVQHTL